MVLPFRPVNACSFFGAKSDEHPTNGKKVLLQDVQAADAVSSIHGGPGNSAFLRVRFTAPVLSIIIVA